MADEQRNQFSFGNILSKVAWALATIILMWIKQDINDMKTTLEQLVVATAENKKDIDFSKGEVIELKAENKLIAGKVDVIYQKYFLKEDEIE